MKYIIIILGIVFALFNCGFAQSDGEWKTVIKFSGSSTENTNDFTIKSSKWRVVWQADKQYEKMYGGNFAVHLVDSNENKDLIVNVIPQKDGQTVIRKKGTFYFKVMAVLCQWKIEVQEFVTIKKRRIAMSNYAHPETLVDIQWVAEHLNDPKVRIVEVGYDTKDYVSGHISGAVGWAWSTDFQHPIRKDLPDKGGMEELLARSGIENDMTIIVYGARRHGYATFALWLLKIYGHGDVRVMNGNREKWIAEGRPLTTEIPTVTRSVYATKEPDWSIRALRDRVLESIDKPERILVDVRTPEEYHGQLWDGWKYKAEASQRSGHIPGAVSIPWDVTLKEDGTFKSVEELQTLYTNNGVTSDKEVISYCIVGGRSNHTWFVLTYLLGYPKVRLYDGSWAEWSTLIGVPIEK